MTAFALSPAATIDVQRHAMSHDKRLKCCNLLNENGRGGGSRTHLSILESATYRKYKVVNVQNIRHSQVRVPNDGDGGGWNSPTNFLFALIEPAALCLLESNKRSMLPRRSSRLRNHRDTV
jgi:hypothetical protein